MLLLERTLGHGSRLQKTNPANRIKHPTWYRVPPAEKEAISGKEPNSACKVNKTGCPTTPEACNSQAIAPSGWKIQHPSQQIHMHKQHAGGRASGRPTGRRDGHRKAGSAQAPQKAKDGFPTPVAGGIEAGGTKGRRAGQTGGRAQRRGRRLAQGTARAEAKQNKSLARPQVNEGA